MMDIINPWGALRRARFIIEHQAQLIDDLYEELDAADARIAEGHFRNPETGRLGPKGKVFQ
jgi:hypothetical protein